MEMPSEKFVCRICGLLQDEEPWGEDGKTPSFNICFCCGTEFGYEDCTSYAIEKSREKWQQKGYLWHEPKFQPPNWSPEQQLNQIPVEYQ